MAVNPGLGKEKAIYKDSKICTAKENCNGGECTESKCVCTTTVGLFCEFAKKDDLTLA